VGSSPTGPALLPSTEWLGLRHFSSKSKSRQVQEGEPQGSGRGAFLTNGSDLAGVTAGTTASSCDFLTTTHVVAHLSGGPTGRRLPSAS